MMASTQKMRFEEPMIFNFYRARKSFCTESILQSGSQLRGQRETAPQTKISPPKPQSDNRKKYW